MMANLGELAYFTLATVCKGVRAHVRHFNEWWLYIRALRLRYGQAKFLVSSVDDVKELWLLLRLWEPSLPSSGCRSSLFRVRLFVFSLDLLAEEFDACAYGNEFAVHGVPAYFRMAADHSWSNICQKSFIIWSMIALLPGSNIGPIRVSFFWRSFECRTS